MSRPVPRSPVFSLEKPVRRQRVLAVVHPRRIATSCWALARGREVARRRDAELHVLCVLPRRRGDGARPLDGLGALLNRWYGEHSPRVGRRIVRVGHTTELASRIAGEIGADIIVVGANQGCGGHWARVARRASVPVLVARPRRSKGSIVAATDFTDEKFPIFRSALRLASRARDVASVLLLHNVDPRGRVFTRGFGVVLGERAVRQLRDVRAEKILALASRSALDTDGILSSSEDPVNAIVEHAIRRDADLVVVGAHGPSPLRSGPYRRTANRVIERVGGSALVVPLPARSLVA